MKKLFTILTFLFLLFPGTASAHVLKTDGNIGAVMHIDPGDAPVANSPATIYFDIKDKTGQFNTTKCGCRVDILEGGKVVNSDSLSFANTYTFPGKDVYQVELIGTPQKPGDFQPFTLTYDVRVDQDAGVTPPAPTVANSNWFSTHLVHILGIGALLALLVFAIISQSKNK
jgi:hypothetical protein